MTEQPEIIPEQTVKVPKNVVVPIPFFFNMAANTSQTLISSPISVNYKIIAAEAHFRDDAAHNLLFYMLSSNNRTSSTTTVPPDSNIISSLSPTPYLTGEGEIISLKLEYEPEPNFMYIKVFATNNNAYAITGLVVVTIEGHLIYDVPISEITNQQDYRIKTTEEYTQEIINKTAATYEAIDETIKGTYPALRLPKNRLEETNTNWIAENQEQYGNLSNIVNTIPVDVPLEERYKFTKAWVDSAIETTKNLRFMDGLISGISGVIGVSVPDWGNYLEEIFGIKQQTAKLLSIAFEKAAIVPVDQYWNKMYQPFYPSTADLINMVVKEVLTVKDFKEIMTYHGYSHFWSEKYWAAHYQQPDFGSILQAYWRGGIAEEDLKYYLKLVDLDPKFNDAVWLTLKENIPTYQDLINMRTKEVISQEDFSKGLNFHGYFGSWADRLWAAHFTPPTWDDFLRTFRRKKQVSIPNPDGTSEFYTFGSNTIDDYYTLKKLSELADYDPRYYSFFRERMYEDPSPRQARWGYEEGALTEDQVYDLCLRSGLTPEDAKWFTQMQVGFQERPFITRYLNALQSAYIAEAITAEELTARVTEIPRRKEIADWVIKIADVQKETKEGAKKTEKEKLLSVTDLKKSYLFGIITEDDFRTRLQLLGYELLDIDLIIDVINHEKEITDRGGSKVALTVSELLNAFRYYRINEQSLLTELMLRGLTQQEAATIIETNIAKWKRTQNGWVYPTPDQIGKDPRAN